MAKNAKKQLTFSFDKADKDSKNSPSSIKTASILSFADIRQQKHAEEVRKNLIEKGFVRSN